MSRKKSRTKTLSAVNSPLTQFNGGGGKSFWQIALVLALLGFAATAITSCKQAIQSDEKPGEETSILKITGDAVIGKTLTVDISPLGAAEEINAIGISYQWQRVDTGVATDIENAVQQDYVVQEEDEGLMLKALVFLTGLKDPFETSEAGPAIWPPIEGSVSFNDVVLVSGNTLTAAANVTSAGTIYYEWFSGNEALANTGAAYVITEGDVGNFISVRVGTNKSSGLLEAQTSSEVQSASIAGNVTISGSPLNPSKVLSVTASFAVSEIASYKWSRDGTTQVGTSSTYTLQEADVGHTIKLVVTRTGYTGIEISAVTNTITWPAWTGTIKFADANPASPIAGVPFKLEVTAGNGAGTQTITWKLVGASETDVTAANLAGDKLSYTPALTEKGKKLKVTVSYSKNEAPKTLTSTQSVIPLTIKYNANGGTGTMADSEFAFGDASAKLRKNTFTKGNGFSGWATTATGAKAYDDEAKVSELTSYGTGTITLYAVSGYTISYYSNYSGGPAFVKDDGFISGNAKAANTFTRTDYAFVNWNKKPDGTGTSYKAGESITAVQDMALFAIWVKIEDEWKALAGKYYEIGYVIKSGSSSYKGIGISIESIEYCTAYTIKSPYEGVDYETLADGKIFEGWSISAPRGYENRIYQPGDIITGLPVPNVDYSNSVKLNAVLIEADGTYYADGTFTASAAGTYTVEVWGSSDIRKKIKGGYSKGDIILSAGQKLTVTVGKYNGGGAGGKAYIKSQSSNYGYDGDSGNGRTVVSLNGAPILIAGGSGGSGGTAFDLSHAGFWEGGSGGVGGGYNAPPTDGANANAGLGLAKGGLAGSQSEGTGGAGGKASPYIRNSSYTYAANSHGGGGGGGAGYQGGAGGEGGAPDYDDSFAVGGGGGGGSGWADTTKMTNLSGKAGERAGEGLVKITKK